MFCCLNQCTKNSWQSESKYSDSAGLILAEVSALGEVLVSGCDFESDDPFVWNGEELNEALFEARFQLHPLQHLLAADMLGDDVAEAISREFGAHNAAYCDNLVSVDTLISHKPFTAPGGMAVYYKWTGQGRLRFLPCDSWEEYRAQRAGKS